MTAVLAAAISWLKAADVPRFLAMRKHTDDNVPAREFEAWVRTPLPAKSRGK
jgi:hypothetical protein